MRIQSRRNRKYGWKPSRPKLGVIQFRPKLDAPIPDSVDLRPHMPPVYDQGELGSCTANAIAAAFDFERAKHGLPFMSPSRLFIYANERLAENTPLTDDSGAQIVDGVHSVSTQGVCSEKDWPYIISNFSVTPPQTCYDNAKKDTALQYQQVQVNAQSVMQALAQGNPVVIGITVYESFESGIVAETGVVPLPQQGEQCLGGHAVLVVGYDALANTFVVRNSWGSSWGNYGHFTLPFQYLETLGSDFWALVQVS